MDLLEDLKMSLLNFNFVMIQIIYKVLVLLKNYVNYLKNSAIECFLEEYNERFLNFFSQDITEESLSLEERNIITDIINIFRLKNELNQTIFKRYHKEFQKI